MFCGRGGWGLGTVEVEQHLEIIDEDMEALECVFATGTVICNGPRRSTTAKSGARIACLIAAPEIGVEGFVDDTEDPEEDDGGEGGINPEFED